MRQNEEMYLHMSAYISCEKLGSAPSNDCNRLRDGKVDSSGHVEKQKDVGDERHC